jgi:ABC-type transport system involved in Fe-S cluster assembly fused permease/ATPase subunit
MLFLCGVVQAVARRVAYQTFNHVLELDITFHMNRRTGRLSRILERGGWGQLQDQD